MFGRVSEKRTLGQIAKFGPQNGFYRKGAEVDGDIPIIKMKELFAGDEICNTESIDKVALTADELKRFSLSEDDLLFGRRSLVPEGAGKCARISASCGKIIFESSILRIRIDSSVMQPLFVQYWFKTPQGESEMSGIRSGTTIIGIKGSDLKNVQIPVPSLDLQNAFIAFFNQADKSGYFN